MFAKTTAVTGIFIFIFAFAISFTNAEEPDIPIDVQVTTKVLKDNIRLLTDQDQPALAKAKDAYRTRESTIEQLKANLINRGYEYNYDTMRSVPLGSIPLQ